MDCEAPQLHSGECHATARRATGKAWQARRAFDPLDAVALYDGRTLLGYVASHGSRWTAGDADARSIGSFTTKNLARRAGVEARAIARPGR